MENMCIEYNHVQAIHKEFLWPFGTFMQKTVVLQKLICQINTWHVPVVQKDWLRFSYLLLFVISFLLITLVALCKPLRMYTSLLSIHFSAKRLFLWWSPVSPCFNLAWVTPKGIDFQFFLTVPHACVFLLCNKPIKSMLL